MTRREEIIEFLKTTESTIKELGLKFGVPSQVIADDLEHIFKTLKTKPGEQLFIRPAQCLNEKCGYVFSANRKRFADPSKCPECHGERIAPQVFKIGHE
jgi:predicted Zn-ribbon and HTH transcriptional regulator